MDVHRYLKLFTFESLENLETLMQEHQKDPPKRIAQHKLAREILEIVHGEKVAEKTEQEHKALSSLRSLSASESKNGEHVLHKDVAPFNVIGASLNRRRTTFLPASLVYDQPISKIIFYAGLVASRGEGQRLVDNGGVYIGSRSAQFEKMSDQVEFSPVKKWLGKETEKFILDGDSLILRIGKLNLRFIKIVSDELFSNKPYLARWKAEQPDKSWSEFVRDMTNLDKGAIDSMAKAEPGQE